MGTRNLCFEQKYEKYQNFLSECVPVLVVKFSVYFKRRVFITLAFLLAIPNTSSEDYDQIARMFSDVTAVFTTFTSTCLRQCFFFFFFFCFFLFICLCWLY